jgi:ankyrin
LQEGDNLLAAAAIGGNSELVHWLMEHCGMTPGLDYFGRNILLSVCYTGDIDLFDMFVSKYELPPDEWFENHGRCPLIEAAAWGQFPLFKHMIEKYHLDVKVKCKNGHSPLHHASHGGSIEMVDWLVDTHGFNVKEWAMGHVNNCLNLAARCGHTRLFNHLIQKYNLNLEEFEGDLTCLHCACRFGHHDLVTELITRYCCDPEKTTSTKERLNSLHLAASAGHLDIVRDLVDKYHMNIAATTKDNKTAVWIASFSGHKEIVQFLMERHNFSLTQEDSEHITPVDIAVCRGNLSVVRYLVNKGYNINHRTSVGMYPLLYAAGHGHLHIVKELVDKMSANISCTSSTNRNALHLACAGGHLKVVKYLIPKFGDDKFDMDSEAENCLHKAVAGGHLRLVTYLIKEQGFDPNLREAVSKCNLVCNCI